MCKHEHINCPCCQRIFECKTGTISQCQCMNINLDAGEREYIAKRYDSCLCIDCMRLMKKEYHNKIFQERFSKISVLFKPVITKCSIAFS